MMGKFILDKFIARGDLESVYVCTNKENFMKDNFKIINELELALKFIQMVIFMLEIF